MLVELAVQQVLDNLMEEVAAGPFDTPRIIDKLNAGIRKLRNAIIEIDRGGSWFGAEAVYSYLAGTRWVALAAFCAGYIPNQVYALHRLDSSTTPVSYRPVPFIPVQDETDWIRQHSSSEYAAILMGGRLGLRVGQSETPPAATLRLIYEDPFVPIDRTLGNWATEKVKDIGTTFPFPADCAEAIVAFATYQSLTRQENSGASRDWKNEYEELKEDVLTKVRRGRQSQTLPSVRQECTDLWTINEPLS